MKVFVVAFLFAGFGAAQDILPKDCLEYQSLRVVNWNIMSPMWVDVNGYHPALVDRRLLNDTTRLSAVIETLKQSNADIILLQEVQEDWRSRIESALKPEFDQAIFASHVLGYWRTHLPRQRQYQANGGAIFYRPSKLVRIDWRAIRTTASGNMVTTATFALKRNGVVSDLPRVIVANGQLERGILGFSTRRTQVQTIQTALLQLKRRFRTNKSPEIIWSGDFNTFIGLPEYADIIRYGYENVFDAIGVPNPPNYFRTIGSPHTTSYTFIENNGVSFPRIKVIDSFFDPTADTRDPQTILDDRKAAIASYVEFIQRNSELSQSEVVELLGPVLLQVKYDIPLNGALRRGSDHTFQRTLFCLS